MSDGEEDPYYSLLLFERELNLQSIEIKELYSIIKDLMKSTLNYLENYKLGNKYQTKVFPKMMLSKNSLLIF